MAGFLRNLAVASLFGFCTLATAQSVGSIPAVMLSDLHFDPLRDPAKADRLAKAPVEAWDGVLKEPASPDQAQQFAAIQQTCKARGVDSDSTLMDSSLRAAAEKKPAFVTVTGDLLVHDFDCRYKAVFHHDEGYAEFAQKTAVYVMRTIDAAFPGVPVYLALGNNDSSCGDYRMNPRDRFLAVTSPAVLDGLRGASAAEKAHARKTYEAGGYYSVPLHGVPRVRMVVLDDIFMSNKYKECGQETDAAADDSELAWLRTELSSARASGEKAWVIGHIPPGIDVYTTLKNAKGACPEAVTFLADNRIAEILEQYADVVRVALFAHTHSDELRLLEGPAGKVALKMVSSISPINGNRPTFTVAQVDRGSGTLQDYSVFEASNSTGVAAAWNQEYQFGATYREPDFSARTVEDLIGKLRTDASLSRAYEDYFTPDMLPILAVVWHQYACALDRQTAESYKACSCGTGK